MDLIPKAQREMLFTKRKEELEHLSKPLKVNPYCCKSVERLGIICRVPTVTTYAACFARNVN